MLLEGACSTMPAIRQRGISEREPPLAGELRETTLFQHSKASQRPCEMCAARSLSATSLLQTSAKSGASRAAPRAVDQQKLLCRSPASKSRAFTANTGHGRPKKAASILTLICAVGSAPGRAYASTMTQAKTATFAAVSLLLPLRVLPIVGN